MNIRNQISPRAELGQAWTCLDVDLGAISHTGHVRENNEDSYLVIKFGRSLENLLTNVDEDLLQQRHVGSRRNGRRSRR
jgi:hypothetical protein